MFLVLLNLEFELIPWARFDGRSTSPIGFMNLAVAFKNDFMNLAGAS